MFYSNASGQKIYVPIASVGAYKLHSIGVIMLSISLATIFKIAINKKIVANVGNCIVPSYATFFLFTTHLRKMLDFRAVVSKEVPLFCFIYFGVRFVGDSFLVALR